MKVFYILVLILFFVFLALYLFMSIRLNILSKRKEKIVAKTWTEKDLQVVSDYKKATRVTLNEIFLGIDNGKASKKWWFK